MTDFARQQEALDAEMRRLQQAIRPAYTHLSEEECQRSASDLPPASDAVSDSLHWVDVYQYHGEGELAGEMLVAAAALASVNNDLWGEIVQFVAGFGVWTPRVEEICEHVRAKTQD